MAAAGVNMATFYFAVFRAGNGTVSQADRRLSLFLWIGVIVFGRMLTFFRPADCGSTRPHLSRPASLCVRP